MGFFRRDNHASTRREEVTVGVGNHRVVFGGHELGVTMLPELRNYVGSVTGGAAQPVDGRDSVAVLSAKMDLAELVNDAQGAVALAFEEVVARGLVRADEVPPPPELPAVPERGTHYDYIHAAHTRAEVKLEWLARADALLRERGVGVLPPRPGEDPDRRGY